VLDEPRRFRDEFMAWRELLMMMPQAMANTAKRPEPGTQVTRSFHKNNVKLVARNILTLKLSLGNGSFSQSFVGDIHASDTECGGDLEQSPSRFAHSSSRLLA